MKQFACVVQNTLDKSKFECLVKSQLARTLVTPFLLTFSKDHNLLNIDISGKMSFGYTLRASSLKFLETCNRFGKASMRILEMPICVGLWSYAVIPEDKTTFFINSSVFVQVIKALLAPVANRITFDAASASADSVKYKGYCQDMETTLRIRGNDKAMSIFLDIESVELNIAKDVSVSTFHYDDIDSDGSTDQGIRVELVCSNDTYRIRLHFIFIQKGMTRTDQYSDSSIAPFSDTLHMSLAGFVEQSVRRAFMIASIVQGVASTCERHMEHVTRDICTVNAVCCSCGALISNMIKCKKCRQHCTCWNCLDNGLEHYRNCDASWAIEVLIAEGII